ncbi:MAG: adenylate kinase [Chthoniobacter sp.]|jgi:adenylate kinase|nr:adenylate kinase [Chthoniobacter sp.]
MIQAKYQFPVTSPGAILREETKAGTPLGIEAEKLTSQGKLVPDEMVNGLVQDWLAKHDGSFVFDGYPRSLGQAAALNEMLEIRGTPLDAVLSLDADLETIRDRVMRRLMCSRCGGIVSIGLHVARSEAGCPVCGGALVKRGDDTPETLELRLREYADKTEPLIASYTARGLLRGVDARGTRETVFQTITTILEAQ